MLTGMYFGKVRPDWLKNPETNQRFALDLYNDRYRLAFECHDSFHSKPVWGKRALERQMKTDLLKKRMCADVGVKLYIIPYYTNSNHVVEHIQSLYNSDIRRFLLSSPL